MGLENFWTPKKESDNRLREEVESYEDNQDISEDEKEIIEEQTLLDLVPTADLLEKEEVSLEEVHEWYSDAISRRDRQPLELGSFIYHFEGASIDPTFAFGEKEKGFLLGCLKYGVFIPTHFAPRTMRGGYDLMKELGNSATVPAVLAITEDLKKTLSKMPSWHSVDTSFLSRFREELTKKEIMYNSHPDTPHLMWGLVAEYVEEASAYEKNN